jgi:hypothetical protein
VVQIFMNQTLYSFHCIAGNKNTKPPNPKTKYQILLLHLFLS